MRTIVSSQNAEVVAPGFGTQYHNFNVGSHSSYFMSKVVCAMRGYYLNLVFQDHPNGKPIEMVYWRLTEVKDTYLTFTVVDKDLMLKPTFNGEEVLEPMSMTLPISKILAFNIPP